MTSKSKIRQKRSRQSTKTASISGHPTVDPAVVSVTLDGEVTVYDPRTDRTHLLNEQASVIWNLCDGTRTASEVVEDVSVVYQIPVETVKDSVFRTIRKYSKLGALQSS